MQTERARRRACAGHRVRRRIARFVGRMSNTYCPGKPAYQPGKGHPGRVMRSCRPHHAQRPAMATSYSRRKQPGHGTHCGPQSLCPHPTMRWLPRDTVCTPCQHQQHQQQGRLRASRNTVYNCAQDHQLRYLSSDCMATSCRPSSRPKARNATGSPSSPTWQFHPQGNLTFP